MGRYFDWARTSFDLYLWLSRPFSSKLDGTKRVVRLWKLHSATTVLELGS